MKKSSRSSPRPRRATLVQLANRHQALLRQIGGIGPVLRGTIGTYRTQCGSPGCRCHTDPAARHGPYHIWTRKVSGKTVTRMLSGEQATLLRPWTKNMRRLDRLVTALQETGLRAADAVRSVQ
ncbi:MAG: DUF6788 family protein [Elusimicrobiota bacterium]